MNEHSTETRQKAIELNRKGLTARQIAIGLSISVNTVRNWILRYDNSPKARRIKNIESFKYMFLRPYFTYELFTQETGVSRATAIKWRKMYFPEITTKEALFRKLIKHNNLSINEIALLLDIRVNSVHRFARKYKAYHLQGYEKQTPQMTKQLKMRI